MKPTFLSREELYNRVWETPILQLAKEFFISDVGLTKICKRHKIPTPPLGYWRKVETGIKVKKPKLPPLDDPFKQRITIRPNPDRIDSFFSSETLARIEDERAPGNKIVVRENLDDLHPVVAATCKSLRGTKAARSGLITPRAKGAIKVSVGPDNIERTVRTLDALVRAVESRGMKLGTDAEKNTSWIDVHGEKLGFTIRERTRKTRAEWTTWDRRKGPFEYWDHELLGQLILEISSSCRESFRQSWTDGKKQRIEGCLNAFLIGLYKVADARRYHRRKDEEERLARIQREEQRREKRQLIEDEEKRVQELLASAEAWDRSQKIRRLVEAVREKAEGREDDASIDDWARWALAQADREDPTVESPPSILDEKDRWGKYPWG